MLAVRRCEMCGSKDKLQPCSTCKCVYYCCKDHQIMGWKRHRKTCVSTYQPVPLISNNFVGTPSPNLYQEKTHPVRCIDTSMCGRIDAVTSPVAVEIRTRLQPSDIKAVNRDENKSTTNIFNNLTNSFLTSKYNYNDRRDSSDITYDILADVCYNLLNRTNSDDGVLHDICLNVVQDMDSYGVSVVDNFLGLEEGQRVLEEVHALDLKGSFQDGQLVSKRSDRDLKTIRSDRIAWIGGKQSGCQHIDNLTSRVDRILMECNKMSNNGKMGQCKIHERTKAMVACYPGNGSHYVKHVDNPNKDGRRITAIYYLNREWNTVKDGGLLRIFPEGREDVVADIAPIFDRLLFFWSDRRNPHEVQPAYRMRYAITLWYFDADERKQALEYHKGCVSINKRLKTDNYNQNLLIF